MCVYADDFRFVLMVTLVPIFTEEADVVSADFAGMLRVRDTVFVPITVDPLLVLQVMVQVPLLLLGILDTRSGTVHL